MSDSDLSPRSIRDSVTLVTGSGMGMGRATARLFFAEGGRVAVTDINGEQADAVAGELDSSGRRAKSWRLDVSDADEIEKVIEAVASHFGRLDCIVNNAGVSEFVGLGESQYDATWERCLTVLLTAQQRVVRSALPYLRESAAPRIVNIASTEALGATPGNSVYAAAKAGVTGLTRALAVDLGPDGITVNCICPGPILTGMTEAIPEPERDRFARRRTALRRYGAPEEVAHITLSLCLPAASYITGAVIPVDGGLMARNA